MILIVEDVMIIANAAEDALTGAGYTTLVAHDGREALRLLREYEGITFLFTDIILPGGMKGFDVVEEAKAINPNLRILLTTGFIDLDTEYPIITKPYRPDELVKAVTDIRRATGEEILPPPRQEIKVTRRPYPHPVLKNRRR